MDESSQPVRPNPVIEANILSKQSFWWLNGLFKKGYTQTLDREDLFDVCPSDASGHLGDKLGREWQKELEGWKQGKQPSLFKAFFRAFGLEYFLVGLIVFTEEQIKVLQPLLLGGLIKYFVVNSEVSRTEAWLYAAGMSMCVLAIASLHHPYFFQVQRIGMRMRVACCSLMYKKCLKLSNKAMGETTTGQIVNLMSNDVNRFDQAMIFYHYLWVGPLQALTILVILCLELGSSVVGGFLVLMLFIPLGILLEKVHLKIRTKATIHRDERIKIMNEIIAGMRVIKMYCWEKPFGQLVDKIRKNEVRNVKSAQRTEGVVVVPYLVSDKIILLVTFVVMTTLAGQDMTAYRVFLIIGFFNACRLGLTLFVPFAISNITEMRVVLKRVQKFLLLDEVSKLSVENGNTHSKLEECSAVLNNVTGKWVENVDQNTIEDVTLKAKPGQLIAVIGKVGSGKSSLLMSLLGELPVHKGDVKVTGKTAYVSQLAWIFSGSIRQNILFGAKYESEKYNTVIYVAALKRDFEIMPDGDGTLIGDRGVSLSGGQKARVSLARALYMDADVYLLDDPLSAVDSAVAKHLFERCILRYLKNKTRILVTHQIQFLPDADEIYILNKGKVSSHGSFNELSQSGVDFSELLKEEENEYPPASPTIQTNLPLIPPPVEQIFGSMMSLGSMVEDYEPEPVNLPEEEERAKGSVGINVYVEYFKAATGLFKFSMLILINILAQIANMSNEWWLAQWANQEEDRLAAQQEYKTFLGENNITAFQAVNITSNITIPYVDSKQNISIYAAIIFAILVFGLSRLLFMFAMCVDASATLHNRMFTRIMRVPVLFFDTNPIGRVLNRFTKDLGMMDDRLPFCFYDFLKCFIFIISIIIVAGVINPYVFIPTLPLVIVFGIIRRYYLRTSRSLKRLEGILRSPVFSYLSASLQGLPTIRSMGMESTCIQEFDRFQDGHTEAWYLFLATSRWLAVRLDWLCVFFITAITFCAMLVSGTMSAGLVGLSVTYSMALMGQFQWGVRQSTEVENHMIAVERVIEYSRLPEEAELESEEDKKPPSTWPMEGAIMGEHIYLQYSPTGPYVLKDLSFTIEGKEKIGIVGRTGAGKSSLITALFRMAEPEGLLMIDGLDILNIGLHDLRKTISIIPQDPFLFTGTLRKNLDPFSELSDELLWRALDEVKLKEQIQDLPQELDTEVSEGGSNFSVGQRQLVCLARAVLRNNKILLIDEATANVDPITDELIQATIRTKFQACTVLTIAHRLHTIMDSDRVMVLDNGAIVEFDAPYTLLNENNGYFYDMAQQTSKAEFDRLLDIAREAALKRSKSPIKASQNGHVVGNKKNEVSQDDSPQDITRSLNDSVESDNSQDDSPQDITRSLNDSVESDNSQDDSPQDITRSLNDSVTSDNSQDAVSYTMGDIEDSLDPPPKDEEKDDWSDGSSLHEKDPLLMGKEDDILLKTRGVEKDELVEQDSPRNLKDVVMNGENKALLSVDAVDSGQNGEEDESDDNDDNDDNK